MHLLLRRHSRSGYGSPVFHVAAVLGFVALAVWGAVEGDWLVAGIASAMAAVAAVGGLVLRTLAARERGSAEGSDDDV